jgi:peroxiredoxin
LAEYRDRFSELTSLGLSLAALSVDTPPPSHALVEQLGLPYPLLCDSGREAVQAYGVFNQEENGGIAYPATFVLDLDRTVRFRSLDRTSSRVDLDGLFAFLRSGLDSPAPATPARSGRHSLPRFRDFRRALASALRYGVRSPKS